MSTRIKSLALRGVLTASLGMISLGIQAQPIFFDDFEDRAQDQATLGNNWTWFDQTWDNDDCSGANSGEFGPFSDGDGSDYVAENRNFWTASEDQGQGDSYFRAGLEVPAWEGGLSNMLRVYGNQFNTAPNCQRVLIFQEYTIEEAGPYVFEFDVAQDQFGAPMNGERVYAFVKVLRQSDLSYETMLFDSLDPEPPVATTPLDVTTARRFMEFNIPEEWVGELLQFGFYNDQSANAGQSWANSAALYDNVTLSMMEIGPAHSGSFYNDSQSGHGFSVEFGVDANGDPLAVIYWYTYDDQGNPIFMLGVGVPDGNSVTVSFQSPTGMKYGEFDPDSVDRNDGGTGVFEFTDRDNATFSYTPSMFSMNNWGHMDPIEDLALIKLFGIPADRNFPVND